MSKIWLIVRVAIGVILSLSWHEQTIVIATSTGAPVCPAGSAGIGSSHPGNGGPLSAYGIDVEIDGKKLTPNENFDIQTDKTYLIKLGPRVNGFLVRVEGPSVSSNTLSPVSEDLQKSAACTGSAVGITHTNKNAKGFVEIELDTSGIKGNLNLDVTVVNSSADHVYSGYKLVVGEAAAPTEPPVPEPTDPPVAEPTDPPAPEPTDPPVSKPTDPPVDEETDAPVSKPTDPPVDEETDAPVPEPTDPPQEETDSPTSFFFETPQPTAAYTPEPTSELSFIVSIEYPTDATRKPRPSPVKVPVKKPRTPPVDEPVKKPRAPPVDEPVKKPRKPPVEEPVEKPVKKPRKAPVEEPDEDKPAPAPRKKLVHAAPIFHMFDKPSRKPTRRPTRDPTVSPEPSISSMPTRAPPNLSDLLASMMEIVEKIQDSDDESDNMKEFVSITSQILDRYVVYNYTIDDEDL